MYKFTLSTDSTCDLYHDFIVENDIKHVSLTFTVEKNGKMDDRLDNFTEYEQYVDFYNELRGGAFSRTSMLNYESHLNHFMKIAAEGAEDVVHFTISSGLSPAKPVGRIALQCRNEGMTAKEAHDLCNSLRLHIQHFIVADDLSYLRKGGRVSAVSAAVGGMLNIKPIISFDKEGKLVPIAKVKGPKKAISYIKQKLDTEGPDPEYNYVFIVHTDNEAPVKELEEYVKEKFGIQPYVSIMGPVIGSHVGPGAFALGYLSKSERNEF